MGYPECRPVIDPGRLASAEAYVAVANRSGRPRMTADSALAELGRRHGEWLVAALVESEWRRHEEYAALMERLAALEARPPS